MTEVTDFHYELPDDQIAQDPVEPRDSSRLLDSRDLSDHHFWELPGLIEPGDLLVINETRVRRARLFGEKEETGGRVEVLLLGPLPGGGWRALARPARRLRQGSRIRFGRMVGELLDNPVGGMVTLELWVDGDVESAIEELGSMPLPPYIKKEISEPERYQTVYSRTTGSAAAPTAGLHFTERVIRELRERGVEIASVELKVGIDTFRPISVPQIEHHSMHAEWCRVPEATAHAVEACRERGGRVVAVGTTTVRTLESHACEGGRVMAGEKETRLFLKPGIPIRVVDLLVTNFHLPASTLLVLLETFMGPGWRQVYFAALERGYRFLSFGDAMLCERKGSDGR